MFNLLFNQIQLYLWRILFGMRVSNAKASKLPECIAPLRQIEIFEPLARHSYGDLSGDLYSLVFDIYRIISST